MENALKALKNAEERANEVEKSAADKSEDIVKGAEESVKEIEVEVERMAKESGERYLSARVNGAKAESAKIREKVKVEGEGIEKKAKERLNLGADQVVNAVVKRMKSGE